MEGGIYFENEPNIGRFEWESIAKTLYNQTKESPPSYCLGRKSSVSETEDPGRRKTRYPGTRLARNL